MQMVFAVRVAVVPTKEIAVSKVVNGDVVLDADATGAVDGDAAAEGVPDCVRPDEGTGHGPVGVDVQGHVVVHRVGSQHEHLQVINHTYMYYSDFQFLPQEVACVLSSGSLGSQHHAT